MKPTLVAMSLAVSMVFFGWFVVGQAHAGPDKKSDKKVREFAEDLAISFAEAGTTMTADDLVVYVVTVAKGVHSADYTPDP